jgi:hypothetical protein
MWRAAAVILMVVCGSTRFLARGQQMTGCLAGIDYEPSLVANPDSKVTFRCAQAAPLDLIKSVGRQTRIPIGIVLGRNPDVLTSEKRAFDLENVSVETALAEAVRNTGYTLELDGGVWVILAGDRTLRQNRLLMQRYPDFKFASGTLVEMGTGLTMWMCSAADPEIKGFAASILGSLNDEKVAFNVPALATTKEIANLIVSQGSKGMWILRVNPNASAGASEDEVEVEPYQHYSNRPVLPAQEKTNFR